MKNEEKQNKSEKTKNWIQAIIGKETFLWYCCAAGIDKIPSKCWHRMEEQIPNTTYDSFFVTEDGYIEVARCWREEHDNDGSDLVWLIVSVS